MYLTKAGADALLNSLKEKITAVRFMSPTSPDVFLETANLTYEIIDDANTFTLTLVVRVAVNPSSAFEFDKVLFLDGLNNVLFYDKFTSPLVLNPVQQVFDYAVSVAYNPAP